MSSGVVELVDLTKRFEETTAVDQINVRVESGEFFSLLGPSGCGKTTTLRMIAGFERPTEGRILLDGVDVAQTPPHQRNVHTVFQSYALFPHLDVYNNVAFALKRRKLHKAEIERRVGEALELVQLSARAQAKPSELSGGQQQRVALARALVNQPALLLLDEPLGALDLKLRKQMQVELKQIQREVGITFIYVTHDQEEALTMSDRIAVMDGGVIEQCGRPEDVYERPEKVFVAGFIGVSNLLEGVVEDGAVRLATGALVPAELPDDCAAGAHVHLSVRPEKIWLDEFQDGMVVLDGTLRETVYLGTNTQYVIELGPGAQLVALEQNLDRARADERWELGTQVKLGWKPAHSLVLR